MMSNFSSKMSNAFMQHGNNIKLVAFALTVFTLGYINAIYNSSQKTVFQSTYVTWDNLTRSAILNGSLKGNISEEFVNTSKKVLLFSYMRGGSTFLGELFKQNRDAVYWFEPLNGFYNTYFITPINTNPLELLYFNRNQQKRSFTKTEHEKLAEFFHNIYHCNYNDIPKPVFLEGFTSNRSTVNLKGCFSTLGMRSCQHILGSYCITNFTATPANLQRRNGILISTEKQCFDKVIEAFDNYNYTEYANTSDRFQKYAHCQMNQLERFQNTCQVSVSSCTKSKIQATKTIRLSMESIQTIMDHIPDLYLIYNIRDPRGILSSRRWSNVLSFGFVEKESKVFCERVTLDIVVYNILTKKYKERVLQVKYEDLATEPLNTAKTIYQFINEQLPSSVTNWINRATSGSDTKKYDPFSTIRSNSSKLVDQWKKKLSPLSIKRINDNCQYVLKEFGYHL